MIICNWCRKKFETHAKLLIHHMIKNGVADCPKHPDRKIKPQYGDLK